MSLESIISIICFGVRSLSSIRDKTNS